MQPDSSDAPAYPDESSAKIPKAPCGTAKRAFRAAFPHTLPILAGFLFLGFAYGLLMRTKGFSFLYPMCMAMTIFGGSLEYVTVSMLLSAFAPLETFLMALLIQARHLFYGLSLLGKYAGTGWKKPLLIFGLCDETFSITCSSTWPIRSRSRFLSSVRTCSSRMMESRFRPQLSVTGRAIWVGRRALPVCEVMAAAMTVGLYRLPVSF